MVHVKHGGSIVETMRHDIDSDLDKFGGFIDAQTVQARDLAMLQSELDDASKDREDEAKLGTGSTQGALK